MDPTHVWGPNAHALSTEALICGLRDLSHVQNTICTSVLGLNHVRQLKGTPERGVVRVITQEASFVKRGLCHTVLGSVY